MAYDETLATRVRVAIGAVAPDAVEKRMFGGIAFLLAGNMSVGVLGTDLIVRLGADDAPSALAEPGTRVFDITGRPMKGWLMVAAAALDDATLARWVGRATGFARSLPPK